MIHKFLCSALLLNSVAMLGVCGGCSSKGKSAQQAIGETEGTITRA